ncbi:MAG: hypothetical protein H0X03_04635, partial [Nitrosopumilus sp.]|nr:hypothetical protein [Nitrosopumilus sp.]
NNYGLIDSFFNDIPNRKLLIEFEKDTKVIKILGTDLSKNHTKNQTQNQDKNDNFNIITLVLFSFGASISIVIMYFLYRRGKLGLSNFYNLRRKQE